MSFRDNSVVKVPRYVALPNTAGYAPAIAVRDIGLPPHVANHEVSLRLRALERTRKLAGFGRVIIESYRGGYVQEPVAPFEIIPSNFRNPTLLVNMDSTAIFESMQHDPRANRRGLDDLGLRTHHANQELAMLLSDAFDAHAPTNPRAFMAKTIVQSLTLLKPGVDVRTNY